MKTKTIELFEYSELSPESKEKAYKDWRENNFDEYYLQVELDNRLDELLEEKGIVPISDIKGYPSKHAKLYYSLSHNQGDGLMFEGTFEWKGHTITVKQSGRYYHSHSKVIESWDNAGEYVPNGHEEDYNKFDGIYHEICNELEKVGYETIDDMQSEAFFIEECNSNELYFSKDGSLQEK